MSKIQEFIGDLTEFVIATEKPGIAFFIGLLTWIMACFLWCDETGKAESFTAGALIGVWIFAEAYRSGLRNSDCTCLAFLLGALAGLLLYYSDLALRLDRWVAQLKFLEGFDWMVSLIIAVSAVALILVATLDRILSFYQQLLRNR